ncbi:hypothetical protein RHOFW510R12_28480 [Rhodanobacter sp. FW510-R12]|nr:MULTISPECIES: DUF2065 domain-containing protein [unclassified Rhodanobacter]KZC17516.1 hypothetical protein RHOFW104R8_10975 [Rhodanobacter sp. FW104-R8]KZC28429.1 hypothetical protein RhoFW510T8_11215 [Rhodanobacter sp. FW510-T8]KZC32513.1 hypothetical protein RhoFW510R10_12315 [Rhodanobacter sp. FW510-R10]
MHQLVAASCLLLVLGGLLPFAAPEGWRAMAHEALKLPPRKLRQLGAGAMAAGLMPLRFFH